MCGGEQRDKGGVRRIPIPSDKGDKSLPFTIPSTCKRSKQDWCFSDQNVDNEI